MKKILIVFMVIFMLSLAACAPSQDILDEAVSGTLQAYTPIPTYTPYPTPTDRPPVYVTKIVVQTPTPNYFSGSCRPMSSMDYSSANNGYVQLQAYVSSLPDVRQVSYTIPENLYGNAKSHIVHVTYVAEENGQTYSKRYIVYMSEFGWKRGVFSIDGQCWVDGPK